MGQSVEVKETATVGDVLMIDTDRSFTGQDGEVISPGSSGSGVPGRLAERLFALDLGIDHVFTLQNTVTVRRSGGWDEPSAARVVDVVRGFLRHYDEEE